MKRGAKGIIFLIITCLSVQGSVGKDPSLTVKVDPRVELLSLVFRLAGNPEYNQCKIPAYNIAIEKHFDKFKDHDAVKLAAQLRTKQGISYDAVMNMAVHIKNPFAPEERMAFEPRPETLEERWTVKDARIFLEALNRFVKDTDFVSFIQTHQPFYHKTVVRLRNMIDKNGSIKWFDRFYGKRPGTRFVLIPGMMNGGASYGSKFREKSGDEILYSFLGVWKTDSVGQPVFDAGMVDIVVHEFCHSYVNPLIDKHEALLETAGERIFPLVAGQMKSNAYATWKTMITEYMVRAATIRYLLEREGSQRAELNLIHDTDLGFVLIRELSSFLEQYERKRDKYPTLDAFMPEVAKFFNRYSRKIKKKLAELDTQKQKQLQLFREKGPKIVSMIPANNSESVDPNLKMIVITFDRPMTETLYAVMKSSLPFPELTGDVYFDSTKKTFYMPVKLKSGIAYGFGLNSRDNLAFRSTDGIPLCPVQVRFKTR